MGSFKGIVAGLSAISLVAIAAPAQAASAGSISAEKVRRLDIMLMVSALRCRNTSDGFQEDYNQFSASHLSELNAASRTLKSDLEQQYGANGAKRALDKISVSMANSYGQGHPWLGCRELKQETRDLAANHQPGALLAAADRLLGTQGRVAM